MRCINIIYGLTKAGVCDVEAQYIYQGNSLCPKCFWGYMARILNT